MKLEQEFSFYSFTSSPNYFQPFTITTTSYTEISDSEFLENLITLDEKVEDADNGNIESMIWNENVFHQNESITNNISNITRDLPIDMKFNDGHLLSIIVYSILFVIGSVGNTSVIVAIYRYRRHPRINRVNLLLLHLAIADLLVTVLLMPLEIAWAATVSWTAGDLACRGLSFFRTFGLYLSGFILVCISLDRFFAVVKPLAVPEAHHRGRTMLYGAWIGSFLCSFPQVIIFHVEKHPEFHWYEQCVTFNTFSSYTAELAYNIFGFIGMYGFPLVMIIFSYSTILYEITKVNKIYVDGEEIRRSNITRMGKAKIRTLKMTILIVLTFFLCWTPYNIMSLWYWIDRDSASKVDQRIQKGFFLFAVTNSCFNPLVYGLFNMRRRQRQNQQQTRRPIILAAAAGAQEQNLMNNRIQQRALVRQGHSNPMYRVPAVQQNSRSSFKVRVIWNNNNRNPSKSFGSDKEKVDLDPSSGGRSSSINNYNSTSGILRSSNNYPDLKPSFHHSLPTVLLTPNETNLLRNSPRTNNNNPHQKPRIHFARKILTWNNPIVTEMSELNTAKLKTTQGLNNHKKVYRTRESIFNDFLSIPNLSIRKNLSFHSIQDLSKTAPSNSE